MNKKIIIIVGFITIGLAIGLNRASSDQDTSCPIPNNTDVLSCKVTKVIDGDTVHANCGGKDAKIRLTVIDSYESRKNSRAFQQAYQQQLTVEEVVIRGKKATGIAKTELSGKDIIVVMPPKTKIDRYNRILGAVYIDCVDINLKMLKEHPDVFLKY